MQSSLDQVASLPRWARQREGSTTMDPMEKRLSDKRNRHQMTNTARAGENGTVSPTDTDIAETANALEPPQSVVAPLDAEAGNALEEMAAWDELTGDGQK
ncbi:MAG: hypothetical protein IT339_03630 [Thermomicrobiales bacterium]|nr:hypothetical protein [Thermomicrobiales bacterium]